jgi:AcrR family transcriptional regulator
VAPAPMTESLARRAVERSVADRQERYEREVRRIMEATYELIEQTGTLEPSLRDILARAGLSTQGFYRYFQSKDELMLVLLDEGRRRLVEYLTRRMEAERSPREKVGAWITGVLAQASEPHAAARSRPFVANEDRLAQLFPAEQQASVVMLVDLLVGALSDLVADSEDPEQVRRDAEAIYRLTFATLQVHLIRGTRPNAESVGQLTRFCLRGAGAGGGVGAVGEEGVGGGAVA